MKVTPEQLAEKFKIEELQERLEFNVKPGEDDWYDGPYEIQKIDEDGNTVTITGYRDW